ncbi:hypothetical protein Pcinc_007747 [Petrolisthes cinctipes]|uniref:Tc1-like transposase DDE domain-containing protein n=1 Tax=Petrolisthes cinctipes TaxID=88211 RepID=A0AAE1KWM5_PETCI|nr:hypothetical protein Pcinc_007747 [Petrolisthes cinctipes]
MEQRMEYALKYVDRGEDFWSNVIFCDERTFSTDDNWVHKIREGSREAEQESGRVTAGLFGWMSAACVGELTDVGVGRFNGNKYVKILDEVLLPSVRGLLFPDATPFYLVQDNILIHTSLAVRSWFHEHPEITVLPHPPRSPDLNPIEHIWAAMTKKCDNYAIGRSGAAVVNSALRAWEELRKPEEQARTQSLVDSMSSRLNSVLDAAGGHTKY